MITIQDQILNYVQSSNYDLNLDSYPVARGTELDVIDKHISTLEHLYESAKEISSAFGQLTNYVYVMKHYGVSNAPCISEFDSKMNIPHEMQKTYGNYAKILKAEIKRYTEIRKKYTK
jgi:hypothetical protein